MTGLAKVLQEGEEHGHVYVLHRTRRKLFDVDYRLFQQRKKQNQSDH